MNFGILGRRSAQPRVFGAFALKGAAPVKALRAIFQSVCRYAGVPED